MRDPAVILIERAHQSLKCNTHTARYRGQPLSTLPRTLGSFCLDICQTRVGPPCAAVRFFSSSFVCYYSPMRLHLARIISYAFLNKSTRTAITIDTACPPSLSRRAGPTICFGQPQARTHARTSRLRPGQVREI